MTIPAGGGPGTGNAFETLPSPLDALDDLRSAAKWTLAAAGAVGAALISGAPLVAVGQVHGVAQALIAGAGLVVALGGVGLAIWFTSKVLSPRLTTPETLRSPALAGLRRGVEVDALLLHQEVAVDLARQVAAEKDPARRQLIERKLRRAEGNAARAAPYVRWLLALAHVWRIEADLRRSRWFTLAGGVLVVAGAVLFFSATGGGPTYVPVLTPQVTAVPRRPSRRLLCRAGRPAYSPLPFRGEAAHDDVRCEQARMLCATGGPGYRDRPGSRDEFRMCGLGV